MPSGLKRELGLPATTAIAVGAMVGSGIFILPGVAFLEVGNASVVLAFLVAGILVLPAALSASEMATAMPEDGGSYVYVERGMGPLLGTIAGVGNWFMLSFKGALALVGGVPYLVYALPIIAETTILGFDPIIPIAVSLALVFIVLNVVSTSSTGSLQFVIVALMVVVMAWFIVGGWPQVGATGAEGSTEGLFDVGSGGFLAATALVFISYAGVIKVAAVAEEVKDPGRVIPQAMLLSLAVTTAMYVAVVYVAVGVFDVGAEATAEGLLGADGEGAIMAYAAERTIGEVGALAVVVAALMALASTANAGILSASRFPFAMARDNLAPPQFEVVSERFSTPALAVLVTGGMIIAMIILFPIDEVAKLGSAFQIIVFILVNLALIGFREGAVEGYDPVFTSPWYPWTQIFGMASGFVVLSQIGLQSIAFAGVVTLFAAGYYFAYGRKHVDREGAARSGIRQDVSEAALERTHELFESTREYDVLVAITERTSDRAKRDMVRMATDLGRLRTTVVTVAEFLDVPHRVFHEDHAEVYDLDEPEWIRDEAGDRPDWLPEDAFGPPKRTSGGVQMADDGEIDDRPTTQVEHREIDSEDHKHAIVDYATYEAYDLLVLERDRAQLHERMFGNETDWLLKNAPCDVMLVEDRGFDGADEIAVVAARGTYDPIKLLIADAVAEETGASIHLIQALGEDAPDTQREDVEQYHQELISICTVEARSSIIETDDRVAGLARFVGDADLLVTGVDTSGLRGRLLSSPSNQLVESVECTAVMVQGHDSTRAQGLIGRLLMNYVFK